MKLHQIYAKDFVQNYFPEGHDRLILLYSFIIKYNKSLTELINLKYPENLCSSVHATLFLQKKIFEVLIDIFYQNTKNPKNRLCFQNNIRRKWQNNEKILIYNNWLSCTSDIILACWELQNMIHTHTITRLIRNKWHIHTAK